LGLVFLWEKKLKTRRIKPNFAPYLFHLEKVVISLFQLKFFCGLPKLKQGNTHTNTSSLCIAPRRRMLFFCFSAAKKLAQSAEIRTQESLHLLLTYRTLRQDAIPFFQLFVSDGENELKQVNS